MMEHDSGSCIYGALMSVDINDIFSKNEFLILDVGRKIISKDNGDQDSYNHNVADFLLKEHLMLSDPISNASIGMLNL
ncbi:hypothetical protein Tco_0955384 [Tanacetum coccineum]|uniref:Uncharacterized protein n=1 Tax=Tanacetum coccineum TaxID=301880 RepID=A0ABQ5E725_9ASTR